MKESYLFDKLAEKCYVNTGNINNDYFDYTKFAYLIIQECINLLHSVRQPLNIYNNVGDRIIETIKKHFEIES